MSDKTVQFHSRARREGFTQIDNPVLRSKKLTPQAKVVWGLMCFYARQDDSCFPGQEKLAEQVPCSERALRNYVSELRRVGLVEVQRRGLGLTNVYILHDLDSISGSASAAGQERTSVPPGSASDAGQERQPAPIPVTKNTQRTKTQSSTPSNDGRPCPVTVDRRGVTTEECSSAWAVMDAFNAKAGTRCRAKGFVEKIIRRMREHPELAVGDHEAVIAAVLNGTRWWTGTPDPAIIYGSDEQFERCLNQRTAAVPGRVSVQSGSSRDWDEGLSTGE